MWQINKPTVFIVAIPFIIIGLIFIVLGFNTGPERKTGDGYPLRTFFFLMGGFYIFIILAIIGGGILWTKKQQKELEWFKKFGIPGTAEILSAEQTGVYINKLPQVCLKLSISTGMFAPYTVTTNKVFSFTDMGKLIPGAKFQVLVDPKKPKRFIFI
ncbi:MAG: hypothetical protein ABIL18_03725 [candidate division WOR-3 bacterium]